MPTLHRHQTQASDVMFDKGQVLARQQTGTDAHNRPVFSYVAQPEISCGVRTAVNREAADTEGNVVLVDYVIRLPHGTAVSDQDRFRITNRHGWPGYTAVDCDIVGAVQRGRTAVTINANEVKHGR
ncbi:MAG: hypothetical protein IPM39_15105 [Chloroflexi bacterium]|nr:hypothetical protein [Chloroflexota bacterium]